MTQATLTQDTQLYVRSNDDSLLRTVDLTHCGRGCVVTDLKERLIHTYVLEGAKWKLIETKPLEKRAVHADIEHHAKEGTLQVTQYAKDGRIVGTSQYEDSVTGLQKPEKPKDRTFTKIKVAAIIALAVVGFYLLR